MESRQKWIYLKRWSRKLHYNRHHNEIWVRNINCNGINWWYSLWEGLRSFWTVNGQWMSHELTFSIILDQLRYVWDDLTFDSDSETFLKDQLNIKIVLFQLRFPNKHVWLLYMYLIFVTLPSIHKKKQGLCSFAITCNIIKFTFTL